MKSILYCQNVDNTIKYKIINQYHDSIIISTLQKLDLDGDYSFTGANIGKAGGAGISDHIHFHLVPRWEGDTNFMPVIGQGKVIMEGLYDTYDNLKPHYDRLQ